MTKPDELLYTQFLAGNDDCLRELMERYGNRLTFFINSYIHDVQESEDLMIEAFSRVIAKRPNITSDGFKPYLFKTARNLALRYSAKRLIRPHFGLDDVGEEAAGAELTETIVQTKEQSEILHICLERLPSDYREVLYLIYFEGASYFQAAKIMGKTVKQITNLAYRGKQALGQMLEREGITNA